MDINAFARHLVRKGTVILKFFLNVSNEEQKERFLERPEKHGKFFTQPTSPSAVSGTTT